MLLTENTYEAESGGHFDFDSKYKKLVNQLHTATNINGIMIGVRDPDPRCLRRGNSALYLAAPSANRLSSRVLLPGDYLRKIRIPMDGPGLAGFVATSGRLLHICGVYNQEELQAIDPAAVRRPVGQAGAAGAGKELR